MQHKEDSKENNTEKFSSLTLVNKLIVIISLGLIILFAIAFVCFIIFFSSIGIFEVLGIKYDHWGSIILFILLVFVFDLIIGLIMLFTKVLCSVWFKNIPRWQITVLLGIIQISLDFITVHTIDQLMESVYFTDTAKILLVVIVFVIDKLNFVQKKKK